MDAMHRSYSRRHHRLGGNQRRLERWLVAFSILFRRIGGAVSDHRPRHQSVSEFLRKVSATLTQSRSGFRHYSDPDWLVNNEQSRHDADEFVVGGCVTES